MTLATLELERIFSAGGLVQFCTGCGQELAISALDRVAYCRNKSCTSKNALDLADSRRCPCCGGSKLAVNGTGGLTRNVVLMLCLRCDHAVESPKVV